MSIWTLFVFVLGLYAGTYIPKEWRIRFEEAVSSLIKPKKKLEVKQ